LSPGNFLASGSGSQLSYALALARASYFVRAPKHSRETMLEFKADWALLQSARVTNSAITTSVAAALPLANGRGASSIPRIQ